MYPHIARATKHFIHYVTLLVYKWSFVRSFRYDWDHTAKLERECGMRKVLTCIYLVVSFDGVLPPKLAMLSRVSA